MDPPKGNKCQLHHCHGSIVQSTKYNRLISLEETPQPHPALTLIGPCEVKVDLANLDLKLQENLLSTLYIFFYFFLQKCLPGRFKLLTWSQTMTLWCPFWHIFVRIPAAASPARPPPPSAWFYCYYRSPEGGRSPAGQWLAVRCGASQKFQSVSSRGPCRVFSKWTSGAAPIWGIFRNWRPL
jgi:hypothetical protein